MSSVGGVKLGMRIALRQEPRQSRQRADRGERRGIVENARGVSLEQLDIEAAEMLGEPRPPGDAQQIARLEQRPYAARAPSSHQSEMAAMAEGEQLRHGIRLAERLGGQEDAFVAPIHLPVLDPSEARLKPSRPVGVEGWPDASAPGQNYAGSLTAAVPRATGVRAPEAGLRAPVAAGRCDRTSPVAGDPGSAPTLG